MKIYWILNGLTDFPVCPICGKQLLYKEYSIEHGCKKTCSAKCARILAKQNTVDTCMKRYGVQNGGGTPAALEKIKQTTFKHYGVYNVYQSDYAKDKSKKTCLRRYNCEHYQSSDEFIQRVIATNLKNLGVKYPLQNKNVILKTKNTCLNKYGVEWASQSELLIKNYHWKYTYDGKPFDSAPEVAFYIWLTDVKDIIGIDFEYSPDISLKYEHKGETHFYMPDFRIGSQLFEIKGDHFFKDDRMINPYRKKEWSDETYRKICDRYEAKRQCMLRNGVIILKNAEYVFFTRYVDNTYGKGFLSRCKNPKTV